VLLLSVQPQMLQYIVACLGWGFCLPGQEQQQQHSTTPVSAGLRV